MGYSAYILSVSDWAGQEHKGRVIIDRQQRLEEIASLAADEAFRIVILGKPVEEPALTAERLAVWVPARPLTSPSSVREATASYGAPGTASPLLSRRDREALANGRIYAALELNIPPGLIFSPGGETHLELLAQEILRQAALKPYREALSLALAAPAAATVAKLESLQQELRQLVKKAGQKLSQLDAAGAWPEASQGLERLNRLAASHDAQECVLAATETYPQLANCAEDVYLARALIERPQDALQLLHMRRFLLQAFVPPAQPDLAVDRMSLDSRISFAELVAEPHRFPGTVSSFVHFQRRHRSAYTEHHDLYWREALTIHGRLMDTAPQVDALRRLNSLTELGPPVGEGAAVAFAQLLDETAGCPFGGRLDDELGDNAVCPSCGLAMDKEPPRERLADLLGRLQRALRRQMTRLSSTAVQQVLARSGDPRVEQFLKVVQASQLTSLPDLLDDALLGFLRRFLVEARIQAVLQPIINRLETGPPPNEAEAEQVVREVNRVLQRSFRAAGRSLPPPPTDADVTPA